jgi:hypothetical protein
MSHARLLAAAYRDGAFGALADGYLHRATREDALGLLAGRDAVVNEVIQTASTLRDVEVELRHEGPELSLLILSGGYDGGLLGMPVDEPPARIDLREHRWSRREGGGIVEEIVVTDRAAAVEAVGGDLGAIAASLGAAHPMQPPLGELRSGEGQLAPAPDSGWTGAQKPLIDALHRIWNGRRLDEIDALYAADAAWQGPRGAEGGRRELRRWLTRLYARLPDATFLFDRIEETPDHVAILWRLFGHAGGKRARLIGSTLLFLAEGRVATDDTLIDELALETTPHRPLLTL